MDLATIEPLISASPVLAAVIVGMPTAGKVIVSFRALHGSESKDRAGILKAVRELFRWRNS